MITVAWLLVFNRAVLPDQGLRVCVCVRVRLCACVFPKLEWRSLNLFQSSCTEFESGTALQHVSRFQGKYNFNMKIQFEKWMATFIKSWGSNQERSS